VGPWRDLFRDAIELEQWSTASQVEETREKVHGLVDSLFDGVEQGRKPSLG
jgi:hypothetical protein